MSFMHKMFAIAAVGFVLLAYPMQSKALNGVVPGKSLGKIAIGEPRGDVLTSMKIKPTNNYDLKRGLIEDEWTRNIPNKNGSSDYISLSIWYRQNEVVQIEYCSQIGIMTLIPSFNTLIAENKNLKKVCYSMVGYDESGNFDGADARFYYDDVAQGIAYAAGVQDDFILTTKPGYINVHSPGVSVIPFRGLTKVKLVMGAEAIAYKTEADADRARRLATQTPIHEASRHRTITAHIHKHRQSPVVSTTKSQFPFKWGPYTVKVVKSSDASSPFPQEVHICNAAGEILWKNEANSGANVSERNIAGNSIKDLDLVPLVEGSGGNGTDYYFSRQGGLYLLFSYDFGDSDGITGFANLDHATRPEIEVDHSIVDFDGFAHGQRQVYSCVYKWNGSHYVNATAAFPRNALAAASIAKAAYLRHWQNNPKSDYRADDETAGADSADRVDAIGYWANAMAVGQGDIAKSWLLDHANPQLALHLLRIEKELQKQITPEGEPLGLSMGNGKNLDPAASR